MLRSLITISFVLVMVFQSSGVAVFSLCNGSWEDPDIWSGGMVPKPGDGVYIGHLINYTEDLVLDNIEVTINEYAGLCGDHSLELLSGSDMIVKGVIITGDWRISSNVTVWGQYQCSSINVLGGNILMAAPTGGGELTKDVNSYCYDGPACIPAVQRESALQLRCNLEGLEYFWYYKSMDADEATLISPNTREIDHIGRGEYSVRVLNAPSDTSAISRIYFVTAVGITENPRMDESAISLYPNPFTDQITTHFPKGDLKVYNSVGQLVYAQQVNGTDQISLGHLESGIYLVNFSDTNGMRITKRLVKR